MIGFGLMVRFRLREGGAAGFDALVAETLPLIREREPGTLVYAIHAVTGEPQQRIFYELYADETAFGEHEAQPHVQRFLAERAQYLEGFDVDFLTPTAAAGLPTESGP